MALAPVTMAAGERMDEKDAAQAHTSDLPTPSAGEKRQAALNAALGDYLERRGSPLAIPMRFYHAGRPLTVSPSELQAAHLDSSARIVIFVHGLGQTEACWEFPDQPGVSYGSLLRDQLGLSPFYVRYNTGRRISRNGRQLSALIEQLVLASPAVTDITLVGHSMGGLVIRSACHYAAALGQGWLGHARRCIYLGSPHLGAPLEKAGSWVAAVLGSIDNPVVRLIHEVTDLRGVGIKDLRYGSLLDEDWESADGASPPRRPKLVPLTPGIEHYFVAGTLTRNATHMATSLFGDALVRLRSATEPARRAGLPEAHAAVAAGVAHMHLSHSPDVYAHIRAWLAGMATSSDVAPRTATPAPRTASAGAAQVSNVGAYVSLLADAVERGATAIQQIQEELTARPYDVLEAIPPLALPSRLVRSLHFMALRLTYDTIRGITRASGAATDALCRPAPAAGSEPDRQRAPVVDLERRGPDGAGQ
jgi:pimeloyl-ACP methyl ester carboxylesterase